MAKARADSVFPSHSTVIFSPAPITRIDGGRRKPFPPGTTLTAVTTMAHLTIGLTICDCVAAFDKIMKRKGGARS
jgi:hypothetical protein